MAGHLRALEPESEHLTGDALQVCLASAEAFYVMLTEELRAAALTVPLDPVKLVMLGTYHGDAERNVNRLRRLRDIEEGIR